MAKKETKSVEVAENDKIEILMADINKRFGAGSILSFDNKTVQDIPCIKSGTLSLDVALGIGGYPKGRIIEIFGPESSGKTTLTMHAIVECQKAGGIAAFIDAEHSFDMAYARNLGVDVNNLYISQPDYGEQGLEIADILINTGAIDVIVIDSVAALIPKAELEGEMGESKMGLHARLMSQALRKLTGAINKTNTTCFFINQIRSKLGVIYGSNETTCGGNALKFYASQRIRTSVVSQLKDGDNNYGNRVRATIVKNKVAPPSTKAEFNIIYGKGFDYVSDLIEACVSFKIIDKKGSWYSYGETKLGQGSDAVRDLVSQNIELYDELMEKVTKKLK